MMSTPPNVAKSYKEAMAKTLRNSYEEKLLTEQAAKNKEEQAKLAVYEHMVNSWKEDWDEADRYDYDEYHDPSHAWSFPIDTCASTCACACCRDLEDQLHEAASSVKELKNRLYYSKHGAKLSELERENRQLQADNVAYIKNMRAAEDRLIADNKRLADNITQLNQVIANLKGDEARLKAAHEADIANLQAQFKEKTADILSVVKILRKGPCSPTAPCDRIEDGGEGNFVCEYHDYAD